MPKANLETGSFLAVYPELAKEWHPTKNGELTPADVSKAAAVKVWWLCPNGHEYDCLVSARAHGHGCRYCSNKYVLPGFNDLASQNPKLAAEWHPTKNGELTPDMVVCRSQKRAWWRCENGHEWNRIIADRHREGTGCPTCNGRRLWAGQNDLATLYPKIAAEWHPTKNGNLTPDMVTAQTDQRAWWQCEKGHEWNAEISSRSRSGCPYCSGRKVITGENDLASQNPDLAAQWHPTKNSDLQPQDVTKASNMTVWWQCEKGHSWQAKVVTRAHGSGCPYCAGRKVLRGYNDLESQNPQMAAEFHPTKNGDLKPGDVHKGSSKKIWWLCENGHEWCISPSRRQLEKSGCPKCAKEERMRKKPKSLAEFAPHLLAEFHPTKNEGLDPEKVVSGSSIDAWWNCENGHEYQSRIFNRTRGRGCPYCAGKKVLGGYNDIATTSPALAKEWHPTKNGTLTTQDITMSSEKNVWWLCLAGHEYEARPLERSKGQGCPYCAGKKVWPGFNDLASKAPELAAQWHPTKNGELTPQNVTCQSTKKVWWLYPYDDPETGKHFDFEWETSVQSRYRSPGVPFLTQGRKWPGFNDGQKKK